MDHPLCRLSLPGSQLGGRACTTVRDEVGLRTVKSLVLIGHALPTNVTTELIQIFTSFGAFGPLFFMSLRVPNPNLSM